jgi:hypothetical protein
VADKSYPGILPDKQHKYNNIIRSNNMCGKRKVTRRISQDSVDLYEELLSSFSSISDVGKSLRKIGNCLVKIFKISALLCPPASSVGAEMRLT